MNTYIGVIHSCTHTNTDATNTILSCVCSSACTATVIGDVEPCRTLPTHSSKPYQADQLIRPNGHGQHGPLTTNHWQIIAPDLVVSGHTLSVLEVRTVCADDHRSAAASHCRCRGGGVVALVRLYGWRNVGRQSNTIWALRSELSGWWWWCAAWWKWGREDGRLFWCVRACFVWCARVWKRCSQKIRDYCRRSKVGARFSICRLWAAAGGWRVAGVRENVGRAHTQTDEWVRSSVQREIFLCARSSWRPLRRIGWRAVIALALLSGCQLGKWLSCQLWIYVAFRRVVCVWVCAAGLGFESWLTNYGFMK